jgi:membrane protease YdiL (CAAX protease family)
VVVAALAYGVGHAPVGSLLLPVVALCCGLYWSALRQWTGSLVPALLAHVLWDLTVLFWAPLVTRA